MLGLADSGASAAVSAPCLTMTVDATPVAATAIASAAITSGRRNSDTRVLGAETGTGVEAMAAAIRSLRAGGAAIGGSTPSRRRIA